jgi:hypothetical protein
MHQKLFFISGPSFVKEMKNVTVAVGWEASIDCHVSDAEDYKVKFRINFEIIYFLDISYTNHLNLLVSIECFI